MLMWTLVCLVKLLSGTNGPHFVDSPVVTVFLYGRETALTSCNMKYNPKLILAAKTMTDKGKPFRLASDKNKRFRKKCVWLGMTLLSHTFSDGGSWPACTQCVAFAHFHLHLQSHTNRQYEVTWLIPQTVPCDGLCLPSSMSPVPCTLCFQASGKLEWQTPFNYSLEWKKMLYCTINLKPVTLSLFLILK